MKTDHGSGSNISDPSARTILIFGGLSAAPNSRVDLSRPVRPGSKDSQTRIAFQEGSLVAAALGII